MPSSPRSKMPKDETILDPTYKLLSDVKRSPRAVMSGKGSNYGGGSLSLDGTIMSSNYNPFFGTGSGKTDGANDERSGAGDSPTRRVPQPPGPGAYVVPAVWTPTKGPVHWQPALYPSIARQPSPRTIRGNPVSSPSGQGPVQEDGKPSSTFLGSFLSTTPRSKAFSMASRWEVPPQSQPGPGSYEPLPSAFSPKKTKERCVFGLRPKVQSDTRSLVPGPGTYELAATDGVATLGASATSPRGLLATSNGTSARNNNGNPSFGHSTSRSTTMAGKWSDPTPPTSPHALTYKVPALFDRPMEGHVASIKGRLAHPMHDKNVAHECAKTDHPHDYTKRMKMRPVA
eukprot:GILI01014455.1.p1 GENE.GILI01014455.1~~GILI01014455.1.p1  ORF type:complete len:343 (+),score=61.64 GILI01014455.1:139-1167(+)